MAQAATSRNGRKPPKNRPVKEFTYWPIRVSIWRNRRQVEVDGAMVERVDYSTVVSRQYKDADGNWQSTSSLNVDDLLPASRALSDAFAAIHELTAADREQRREREAIAAEGSVDSVPY